MDEKLTNIWNQKSLEIPEEQIEKSLETLLMRVELFEKVGKQNKKQLKFNFIYKVASIALIVILLSTTIYLGLSHKEPKVALLTYQEYTSSVGEYREILLPDGTVVYLNSGSILLAPEKFISDERKVLLFGEAYFKVAKDEHKPFRVKTNLMEVEALGTEFSVISFLSDNSVRTTLVEGSVKLSSNNPDKNIEQILLPNQQSFYRPSMDSIYVKTVNTSSYTSWITGALIFDDMPFMHVVQRLQIQFGVNIQYGKHLNRNRISAKFIHNESIDEIVKILSEITYSKYHINNNQITIN